MNLILAALVGLGKRLGEGVLAGGEGVGILPLPAEMDFLSKRTSYQRGVKERKGTMIRAPGILR